MRGRGGEGGEGREYIAIFLPQNWGIWMEGKGKQNII
jgi:hypothetical protein